MKRVAVALIAGLLASASAFAQGRQPSVVYTNIIDGQRTAEIVKVMRVVTPAAPVPPSIETTEVLPRNYRPPLGARSYAPPVSTSIGATQSRPAPQAQPWYINGIYAGPSPTGNWMSTSIGRPIIDVHVVSTPRSASGGRTLARHGSRREEQR